MPHFYPQWFLPSKEQGKRKQCDGPKPHAMHTLKKTIRVYIPINRYSTIVKYHVNLYTGTLYLYSSELQGCWEIYSRPLVLFLRLPTGYQKE